MVTVKDLKNNGEDSVFQVGNSHDDVQNHHYRYGKHCTSCSCHRDGWDPKKRKQDDESSSSEDECQTNR